MRNPGLTKAVLAAARGKSDVNAAEIRFWNARLARVVFLSVATL